MVFKRCSNNETLVALLMKICQLCAVYICGFFFSGISCLVFFMQIFFFNLQAKNGEKSIETVPFRYRKMS